MNSEQENRKGKPGSGEDQEKGKSGGILDRKKTTIPKKHRAPDTDEEGIGVVHKPQ